MIDTITPASMAHLVRSTSEIVHQHGGVITRINFADVESMNLEQFKENVLPVLGKDQDKCVIIQDDVTRKLVRIIGDEVVVYNCISMEDVFVDAILNVLPNRQELDLMPTTQYPIIRYRVLQDGNKGMIVSVPAKMFNMNFSPLMRKPPDSCRIYHPPFWLRVDMTPANINTDCVMAVALERCPDPYKTKLYLMPFPNFGTTHGSICFGSTEINLPSHGAVQEGETIQALYDRVFNSNFNDHLYPDENMYPRLQKVYESMPEKQPFAKRLKEAGSTFNKCMVMTHRILSEPTGYLRFPYMDFPISTKEFLDWKIRGGH